jgi:hypothetical protein
MLAWRLLVAKCTRTSLAVFKKPEAHALQLDDPLIA